MPLNTIGILATSAPPGAPSMLPGFLMMAVIFGIFYVLVFAPMRKKQKKHAEMIGNLTSGARVITNGGIHGTVKKVEDHVVVVRIADSVDIKLSRNAVAALQNAEE